MCPPGYRFIGKPRKESGGGVGFMYKSTFEVREDDQLLGDYETMEHLLVEVEGNVTWRIATVYRPPPSSKNRLTNSQFLEDMEATLTELLMLPGRLLIVGDFNLHFDDLSDKHVWSFRDLLEAVGMTQHVTQPTHRDGHILDFVISRQCDALLQDVEVLPRCVSDHHAVTCQLQMTRPVLAARTMPCRKMRNINPVRFARDLGVQLAACDVGSGVVAAAQHYHDSIISVLEKYVPMKLHTIRSNTAKLAVVQWCHLWGASAEATVRAQVAQDLPWDPQRAVCETTGAGCAAHQQCKAGLFPNHHRLGNAKRCVQGHQRSPDQHNHPVPAIPWQRTGTGRPLCAFLPLQGDCYPHCSGRHAAAAAAPAGGATPCCGAHSWRLLHCDICRPAQASLCSASVSCMLDPALTHLLKEWAVLDCVLPHMLHVVNEPLGSSVVPACLKMAVITPILKKPSLCINSLKNFRPILNLYHFWAIKVIQKVVAAQLPSHLSAHGIHDPMQSAYRPGHSTETVLLRIQDDINRGLDAGVGSLLVLLDLSAAFDTIDHTILLEHLEAVAGIQGAALAWLRSYLHGRMPSVIINGVRSTTVDLSTGVPQGSVLGPLLFLVYVIPLRSVIRRHLGVHHHGYADDHQLYTQFNLRDVDSYRHALQWLEMCVEEVRVWLLTNKLKINSDKTEFMVITTPHYQTTYWALQPAVSIGGIRVHAVSSFHNLGVIMDSTIDMHGQIQSVKCAMFHHLCTISNIRHYLDRDTCVKAVLSLVMSRVDYCNSLLVGQSATALRGLQLAQNYAAHLVMGLCWCDHVTPALQALHWLPIHQRVCYQLMCLLHKTLYHRWRTSLHELHGQPVCTRQGTVLCQCHCAPGCTSHPSGLCRPLLLGVGSCSLECAASPPPSLFDAQDF